MKKKIVMAIMTAAVAAGITACGTNKQEETTQPGTTAQETTTAAETATETTTAAETEAEAQAEGYRTGLAVVTALDNSKDAGENDGSAQVDSVVAAIVLDEEGKITACVIDTAQTVMAFSADGKVVTPPDTEFETKKELKDRYGMKAVSPIGKEWYEQAESFEQYVIGKTVAEVKGIAVTENNAPAEEDLAAGVTVKIGGYIDAIEQAAANAKVIGTQPGDKLGLGIMTNMEKSKDSADGKDGQCQAYSTYAAVTADAGGVITGCVIDATQGTVTFDANGKITADLSAGVKTKRQLGDAYGMKPASQIGKEWFEQAAAMEAYVTGKTADEVSGIAVDENNKPADTDLAAGVTVSIGDFQDAIVKAVDAVTK